MLNYLFAILKVKIEQDIFQVIGMAFLTILISVAVAIFGDKKEFEVLDKNVILDHVVKAKFFLFYLCLIFLPLLFWNISSEWFRFVEIILWVIGIYFMTKILIDSYYWIKGNKFSLRFNYMKNLKNIKDMEDSWRSVWEAEKINLQNEQQFFEIFSSIIEQLLKNNEQKIINENLNTILKILSDFDAFINNRSIFLFIRPNGAFSKILEWHFKIWEKEYKYLTKKDKLSEWSSYSEISLTLDSILQKVEKRAFKERQTYSFFYNFEKHTEKYKGRFVESEDKSKKYYYIESLFEIFYRVFFGIIESFSERYDILRYYPEEWKITQNSFMSKENFISRISMQYFLRWASERTRQAKEDFDKDLYNVTRNLFPEVEPVLWIKILTFIFFSYGENEVKSVIEKLWNFSFIVPITTPYDNPEDNEEEFRKKMGEMKPSAEKIESNSTFELAFLFFPNKFSKKNLEKYINNLKELKYDKESEEENRRQQYLAIFEEMLKYKSST